jgi:hypothetical protein
MGNINAIIELVKDLNINELDGLRQVLDTRSYRLKEIEAKKFSDLSKVA